LKEGQAESLAWVHDVDQVVWDALHLICCRFGCADIHAPVEEARISRDDLAIQI